MRASTTATATAVERPQAERVAVLLGVATTLVVLAIGLLLYLAKFQVDDRVLKGAFAALAVLVVGTSWRMGPASRLTPAERLVRTARLTAVFLGLLTGAAILGAIASAAELDSTRDWVMLGVIVSSPVGAYFVVYTRFGIR